MISNTDEGLIEISSAVNEAIVELRGDDAAKYTIAAGTGTDGGPFVVVDICRDKVSVPICTVLGAPVRDAVANALRTIDALIASEWQP